MDDKPPSPPSTAAPEVVADIQAPPARCFAAFCDVALLPSWVPGLRRAKLVRTRADGLPLEVLFEYGDTLSYSVVYEYDVGRHRVSWQPGVSRRDSVAGFAEFSVADDENTTRMRYSIERAAPELPSSSAPRLDEPELRRLVAAFARWVEAGGKRKLSVG